MDWGFWTTRRNPSGIICGSIFWPGKDCVLNSIRAENWREGIEDYEYLHLLKTQLDRAAAGRTGKAIEEANSLLDEVANMRVYGQQFASPPTTDASWILDHRTRIGEAIESLRPR